MVALLESPVVSQDAINRVPTRREITPKQRLFENGSRGKHEHAFLVAVETWKRCLLIGVVVLLLIVELLNTAIEKLADRLTREIDPEIGRVKDMGSAAVGLALVTAIVVWLLALAERLSWL